MESIFETIDTSGYTLDGLFSYLSEEFQKYEQDQILWEKEKTRLIKKVSMLEGEIKGTTQTEVDLEKRFQFIQKSLSDPKTNKTNETENKNLELIQNNQEEEKTYESKGKEIIKNYLEEMEQKENLLFQIINEPIKSGPTIKLPENKNSKLLKKKEIEKEKEKKDENEKEIEKELQQLFGKKEKENNIQFTDLFSQDFQIGKLKKIEFLEAIRQLKTEKNNINQPNNQKTKKEGNYKNNANDNQEKNMKQAIFDLKIMKTSRNSLTKQSEIEFEEFKRWKEYTTPMGHFDGVRSVSWHSEKPILLSGGEDCTVKLWVLNKFQRENHQEYSNNKRSKKFTNRQISKSSIKRNLNSDGALHPITTFRGHTGPVFKVLMDSERRICFSAGADGLIRIWNLPNLDLDLEQLYEQFPKSQLSLNEKQISSDIGHDDAIWDLDLNSNLNKLLSASADATIKLWDMEKDFINQQDYLFPNLSGFENQIPTTAQFLRNDPTKIIAGYTSPVAVLFDVETSKIISSFTHTRNNWLKSGTNFKNLNHMIDLNDPKQIQQVDYESQINSIASHPLTSLIVAGCEDKTVQIYDLNSGKCIRNFVSHLDSVTSVDIEPSGLTFATASHDYLVKFWDFSTNKCLQQIKVCKKKDDESIHTLAFHQKSRLMAIGCADSSINIFN
ncbi:connector of kinase to ap-1 isoform e [Anaeramoeba flamelloides]|uniref:Connector of kinase to ap-1 isoform e n=1 Tax=Anaeramoeba flamelloides TaxID=1746091 RepID=A0AAV7ZGR9_9EUKA|nr:connector of kinase to ap-1 isoform e [Anaeramoeba flamelloides]